MKMLMTDHLRIGGTCAEQLSVEQSHTWHRERVRRFTELLELASVQGVGYIALTGELLGNAHIPESLIDSLFLSIQEYTQIQILFFLSDPEYKRFSYRKAIPVNLHLLQTESNDTYLDDNIALRTSPGGVEMQLADHPSVWLHLRQLGDSVLVTENASVPLPCFEPTGFEDAAQKTFGLISLEWTEASIPTSTILPVQRYYYREMKLELSPADTQGEILQKLKSSAAKLDRTTFLRLTVCGKTSFGITLNAPAMKQELEKRAFFAQVFDNTEMDIDVQDFDTDISLASEFIRLSLNDETVSDTERNRLISKGWNALGGKVVSE